MNQIPFMQTWIDEELIQEVTDTLRSGWITTGPKAKRFREAILNYTQASECVLLSSATTGLELALRFYGIQSGDEVLVPAYSYAASANVILHLGATPVFVDLSDDDFNITASKISEKINEKTKAIISVDFGGMPVDYDGIKQIIESFRPIFKPHHEIQSQLGKILFISDAAHSFGAKYQGKVLSSIADFTVFSFHAVKNLTTGEGGAILISSEIEKLGAKTFLDLNSLHGQDKDAYTKLTQGFVYDIVVPGYKCNLSDLHAAVGLAQLRKYDFFLERRRAIYAQYTSLLSEIEELTLPKEKNGDRETNHHLYPILLDKSFSRNQFIEALSKKGIFANVHFKPIPLMSAYRKLGYSQKDCAYASEIYEKEISLPIYPQLDEENIKFISSCIQEILGGNECKR